MGIRSDLNMFTSECPGQRSQLRDKAPDKLLDRSLLERTTFEMFTRPWFLKARVAATSEHWFEAFIYLWVTFNAWLSQIVSDRSFSDKDWYIFQATGLDPQLRDTFDNLNAHDRSFREVVSEFHGLWPIFKVRSLIENGVESWGAWGSDESRSNYREKCFNVSLKRGEYSPRCFLDHQPPGPSDWGAAYGHVPMDWAHTMSAIYQVRCNLFHGGKSFINSKDPIFVKLAFKILWQVWPDFHHNRK